ncbi:Uncharacterised protein at_DN1088 [Pycnogonum litorale]
MRVPERSTWLIVLLLCSTIQGIHGVCEYKGVYYKTKWMIDGCKVCTCVEDVPVCHDVRCTDPMCDFKQKEELRMLSVEGGSCCPTCLSRHLCVSHGVIRQHDEEWVQDCQKCFCDDGEVHCNEMKCRRLQSKCTKGQMSKLVDSNGCCSECTPERKSCFERGVEHKHNEIWKLSLCTRCHCIDGFTQCYTVECSPVQCSHYEQLVAAPNECCMRCEPKGCEHRGQQYKHGDLWKEGDCSHCKCNGGAVSCFTETCKHTPKFCPHGMNVKKRNGSCCKECLPFERKK